MQALTSLKHRCGPPHWLFRFLLVTCCSMPLIPSVVSQEPAAQPGDTADSTRQGGETKRPSYVLGPNELLTVVVPDLQNEIHYDSQVRVDLSGDFTLPLAGRIHAAGLTIEQAEAQIRERLGKYLKNPDVSIYVQEFHGQPVAVFGQVTNPGVIQLEGQKTLFEVISMAGGLTAEAGNTIKVTRKLKYGRLPIANAVDDPSGEFSTASLVVKKVMDASDPADNIQIKSEDVISVPKAHLVYVVGEVGKPGGFVIGENDSISVLQAIALAEGVEHTASLSQAKIIHKASGGGVQSEESVNLRKLLAGKEPDRQIGLDDILFVPSSAAKTVAGKAAEAALYTVTGLAVYGRY